MGKIVLIREGKAELFPNRDAAFQTHTPVRVAVNPRQNMEIWFDADGHRYEVYSISSD